MDTQTTNATPVEATAAEAPQTINPWDLANEIRGSVLEAITPADSGLVRHALFELERAGELGAGGAYGGMVGRNALDLIRVLSMAGHSGGSVAMTLELFERLARFDVLSPLTDHPSEWSETPQHGEPGAKRLWQSTRKPSVFWREGEPTWYDLDAR